MKVLMIGPARSVHGGISGVVNNYFEAGLDQRVQLRYIGTMVEGTKARKLLQAFGALICFLCLLPFYEIVHVNVASDASYYRKSVFIRLAGAFHKKIVIHQHGGDFEGFYGKELSEKGRKRVRKVLSMGDAFLVLAPFWKEFFGNLIEKDKITVLPDAIELPDSDISSQGRQGKTADEKEYGVHRLLFLGRLCQAKGIGELLEATEAVRGKYPDLTLYLGGIWEDQELQKTALAKKDYVTYLGWLSGEEKKKYLQLCDIFVLPSYFEGQSVAILEAMAYSCAVAASDTGGIPQMIAEGETGLLFPPKDAKALQERLLQLLADPELCKRLGKAARKKAEEEFSMEKNMETLLGIYEDVMQKER